MSPVPSLRDRFCCFLHSVPDPLAFGFTPHHSVSTMMQRSFSDLAAPPVRYVPRGAHRMQPSYCFRGATATHWYSDPLRPPDSRPKDPSRAFTQAWGPALGCVSGRLAPPFLVGLATSIQHPVHLHAGIRLSCLILAYYSCRSRSPVCSKARDATPDFDYAPLYDPLLSQRELPTFAESFWDSVAYFVDLLRFTEYRHTLRLFTVKAATGGAC